MKNIKYFASCNGTIKCFVFFTIFHKVCIRKFVTSRHYHIDMRAHLVCLPALKVSTSV